ncbi:MDR family MFS transporter [Alicyclobacillus fodiniaquatilis]|uniref:MDR family MFS transporter n=1 Tax=Alicyclobacillus fodiniaquatilis TaxID=1661150 RepID=A0ABW4JJV8_9BACL
MNSLSNESVAAFSVRKILPTLLALIFGMLVVMLDSSVMNVAIPQLEKAFHADLKTMQWTITGYTLALSAVIPLAGWFSDRFEAKRVFLLSVVLFMVGSVLCAMATTPAQLITFRVLQGLGGGMVTPIGLAFSFKVAPPDKRGAIMGLLGLPMLIAPVLGPLLSGWLLEYANWHWIFFINVPIGIVALGLGYRFLQRSDAGKHLKLDIIGAILAPVSFATLIYGVHNGGSEGWSTLSTTVPLAIGLMLLSVFIVVELRQQTPLLELHAFRSMEFSKGLAIVFMNWMAIFGALFLIPLYLQQVRGFSTFHSGLMVIPQAVLSFVGMQIGGKLFDKFGARPVVCTGLAVLSAALYWLSRIQADTNIFLLATNLALLGLGQGLTSMQISTHVLKSAPAKLISRVTPITTSGQQIFGSLAIAMMSGFLTSNITKHIQLVTNSTGTRLAAMANGFGDTFLIAMGVSICGLVMGLFLRRQETR